MHRGIVRDVTADARLNELVHELERAARATDDPRAALLAAPAQQKLRALLEPVVLAHGYTGYRVVDRFGLQLADLRPEQIGRTMPETLAPLRRGLAGEIVVSRPLALLRETAPHLEGTAVMLALGPIGDAAGEPRAVIAFGIDAEEDFTDILQVARMGVSGETYAFDEKGVMLSDSRFTEQLMELGMLPAGAESSILQIEVRDPGGDVVKGFTPTLPVQARPLTRMAADAIAGNDGSDVEGYPDYRGVPVIGAWAWVPEMNMGVATEIEAGEAFAGLWTLRTQQTAVIGLLAVAVVGMFVYATVLSRMRSKVDRAQRLGSYRVERKIGEGGMGKVYLARHSLLRRPTAIKLVDGAEAGASAVKRFEREVAVTSGLTHPNTVAIYDYGHTPEGIFYYAMEYLDGPTLGQCVEADGAQPEARVVHLMRQICGSVAEAHDAGIIHRDLKPANVMVCERGGVYDFAKVLDFGLARTRDSDVSLTNLDSLTGTPLYLSPEAIQAPETLDARGDLYQLGGIAYYLLTGRHVFAASSVVDVLDKHLHAKPESPSDVLGRPVSRDLETLILACLEKDRAKRPQSAGELLLALEAARFEGKWGQTEARLWWEDWRARHPGGEGVSSVSSLPSGYQVDLEERSV